MLGFYMFKKYCRNALLLFLAAVTVMSAGCAEAAPAPAEDVADTLVVAYVLDTLFMNPWEAVGANDHNFLYPVYDTLIRSSLDGKTYEPRLARSWEVSEDGLVYTFQLQPDLKFSNGDPVTEEDWIFSIINMGRDCPTYNYRDRTEMVTGVRMPEKDVLEITLREPTAPFLSFVSTTAYTPTQKKHYETVGVEAFTLDKPLGTGPYRLIERKPHEYSLYERNPHYWAADQGLPRTQFLRFNIVPDENTRLVQLQAGVIDLMPRTQLNMGSQVESSAGLVAHKFPSQQMRHILLNTTEAGGPFADIRVRQALRYVTNKQELGDITSFGMAVPSASSIPFGHGRFVNPNIVDPEWNPEKAKELLAAAGYPDGLELTLSITPMQINTDIAVVLQQQWAAAGVKLIIEPLESGILQDMYINLRHKSVCLQWSDSGSDPSSILGFICDYRNSKTWYSGFYQKEQNESPIYKLYIAQQREMDLEKRIAIVHELQQLIYDMHSVIPLFTADFLFSAGEKVKDLKVDFSGYIRHEEIYKIK